MKSGKLREWNMSSKLTDNSRFEEKVLLRDEVVKDGDIILDCYHGEGIIWNEIEKNKSIDIIGIEKEKGKGFGCMYGRCEKIIPSLNLGAFSIIDFDAWGSPFQAMIVCFKNKTLKKGTKIFYTFIQTGFCAVEIKLLAYIGISKAMYKKCPTLYRNLGFTAFKEFLYQNGIKNITNYSIVDKTTKKNYGYFIV